jgi:cytochrome P450
MEDRMTTQSLIADKLDPGDVPIDDLGRIFVEGAAYADPIWWHSAARRLRREAPMLHVEVEGWPPFWAVTNHADVMDVERNPDIFTNGIDPVIVPAGTQQPGGEDPPVLTLIQLDGDPHKQQRGVVNDWFKAGRVKGMQGRIDELARVAVDQMEALNGRCDFVRDVALGFPLQVILSILGLPESDYPRMLQLTQELFGSEDPDIARLGEDDSMFAVLVDLMGYFNTVASDRRNHPTADLASVIANATIDDQPLSDLEMLGHFVIIATAGHETTSSAIAGGMLALVDHPDQIALLQQQPELIDGAADELIRYVSPVKHFMRTCNAHTTVGGVDVEPGERLLLSFASANRDEAVFADPMRLDVQRDNAANHLAFGFGRHFCLGSHLARMEVRALFRELLGRLDHIELADAPTWTHANLAQGPKSAPVTYRWRST